MDFAGIRDFVIRSKFEFREVANAAILAGAVMVIWLRYCGPGCPCRKIVWDDKRKRYKFA